MHTDTRAYGKDWRKHRWKRKRATCTRAAFRSLPWIFSKEPLVFVHPILFLSLSPPLSFPLVFSCCFYFFSVEFPPLWFAFVIFCAYPFFPRDSFISSLVSLCSFVSAVRFLPSSWLFWTHLYVIYFLHKSMSHAFVTATYHLVCSIAST